MLYAVLVLAGFVAGVVVTVLFSRKVAVLVAADVTLGIAGVKDVIAGTELRVRGAVRTLESSVHNKLGKLRDELHGKLDEIKAATVPAPPPDRSETDPQPPKE